MDYRTITNKESKQYQLQLNSSTGDYGIRTYQDRYMIALAFLPVGTKVNLELSGGQIIHAIVGDIKADTDCLHPDGSMIEFIVDTKRLDTQTKIDGTFNELFKGTDVS